MKPKEIGEGERLDRRNVSHETSVSIDLAIPSADDSGPGVGLERPHRSENGRRKIEIIGVQPSENITGRATEALVERLGLSAIGLGHPGGEPWFVAPNEIRAAVRRSAIHHDVLEIRIA